MIVSSALATIVDSVFTCLVVALDAAHSLGNVHLEINEKETIREVSAVHLARAQPCPGILDTMLNWSVANGRTPKFVEEGEERGKVEMRIDCMSSMPSFEAGGEAVVQYIKESGGKVVKDSREVFQ